MKQIQRTKSSLMV